MTPLLTLLPGAIKFVAGLIGSKDKPGSNILLDAVNVLTETKLSPEQQAAFDTHAEKMLALDVEAVKAGVVESTAMIASQDKYTSRARPTAVYAAIGATLSVIFTVDVMMAMGTVINWSLVAGITGLIAPMWGAVGYYFSQRTKEKLADAAGN